MILVDRKSTLVKNALLQDDSGAPSWKRQQFFTTPALKPAVMPDLPARLPQPLGKAGGQKNKQLAQFETSPFPRSQLYVDPLRFAAGQMVCSIAALKPTLPLVSALR